MRGALVAGALLALPLAACQERLATPADCPALCPGTSLVVRDTVLLALPGADSTFGAYISAGESPAMLTSSGLPGREARAFYGFAAATDSIQVGAVYYPYTVDSIVFTIPLVALDTAVKDLKLLLHLVSPDLDSATTFAEVDSAMTANGVLDSLLIPDTTTAGNRLRVALQGDDLARFVLPEADSGRVGIGFRVTGDRPTGIRTGSLVSQLGTVTYVTYAHVAVTDPASQKHTLSIPAERANYAFQGGEPIPPTDILFLGRRSGHRTLVRFAVPPNLLADSVSILRATLELQPVAAVPGLPNDAATVEVRGILADLGAKSPALAGLGASFALAAGTTGTVSIDIRNIVSLWFVPNGAPPVVFLGLAPEGGTFTYPQFFSTRSASGGPRLRLTIAQPTRPGHP